MGYTHYYRRKPQLPKKEFEAFIDDVFKMFSKANLPLNVKAINPKLLHFNGVGDNAHEDVYIGIKEEKQEYENQDDPLVFGFCKTAMKPYDKYVVAVLILAKYHFAPEDFKISSDGNASDWEAGKNIVNKLFGYGCSFDKVASSEDIKLDDCIAFLHPKKQEKPDKTVILPKSTPEEIEYVR